MSSHSILYFGCLDGPGHHLRDKTKTHWQQPRYDSTPWGRNLDGAILTGQKRGWEDGVIHVERKGGWTMVSWADYSVDTRPGSHSSFMIGLSVTSQELIMLAREQWPEVFGRKGFPKLVPQGPAT